MDHVPNIAARILAAEDLAAPWPHCILDDFLPLDVYAELINSLPPWTAQKKTTEIPASLEDLLRDPMIEAAIRDRFNFDGFVPHIELTFRTTGLLPHKDRADKAWSGIVYLCGDPNTGTDLYDAKRNLSKRVPFAPNRLLCWGHRGEQHSVPPGNGRWAIQWWFLKTKQ